MDINLSLQICGWNINGTKEWTHSLTCLLFQTLACIHVIPQMSQPRVACWHGYRKNSTVENKTASLNSLQSEQVKKHKSMTTKLRLMSIIDWCFSNRFLSLLLQHEIYQFFFFLNLTCSCRAYYIFSLSMKQCLDNQINASFIDILRIKWLVFLLRLSSAQLVPLQAPKHRPHPVKQTG